MRSENGLPYRSQRLEDCATRHGSRLRLKHPTREKKARKLRSVNEGENTFEKTARRWLELKQTGLQEQYHKQCLIRMEKYVFPTIGALPITEITIPDVVRVVEKISNRGTIETARKMKQLVGQVFRYAAQL